MHTQAVPPITPEEAAARTSSAARNRPLRLPPTEDLRETQNRRITESRHAWEARRTAKAWLLIGLGYALLACLPAVFSASWWPLLATAVPFSFAGGGAVALLSAARRHQATERELWEWECLLRSRAKQQSRLGWPERMFRAP